MTTHDAFPFNSCKRFVTRMALAALAAVPLAATATEQPVPVPVALPSLESAFWQCDYVATEVGLERVDVGGCIDVYETLKQQKFGGDFERLLVWWQQNKPVEHARLRERLSSRATR